MYTSEYVQLPAIAGMPSRGSRCGFCIEPGRWTNAINKEEWKGMVILRKGETWGARTVYRAWVDEEEVKKRE
jgi:aldose 1-epimerase